MAFIIKHTIFFFPVIVILLSSCKTSEPLTKVRGKRAIERGDTLTLSWIIEKADSIILEGFEEYIEPEGKLVLKPDTTTTYTFFVYRKEEVKRKRFKIEVLRPEIKELVVPDSVSDEQIYTLRWYTENVRYVTLKNIADSLKPSGEYTLQLDTTTLITLIAHGKHDTVMEQKRVKVGYVESNSFPIKVYRGNKSSIHWKFKNCKMVKINGMDREFLPIDTVIISPDKSQNYSLYIFRNTGDIDTVQHRVVVKSPYIDKFNAPKFVKKGEYYTLKWHTVGTKYAILDGDTVKHSGVKKYKSKGSTTHTLTIYDGNRPVIWSETIHDLPSRAFVTTVDPEHSHIPGWRVDVDIIAVDQSQYPEEIKLHVVIVDTTGTYISNVAPPYAGKMYTKRFFTSLAEKVMGKTYAQKFDVREIRHDTTMFYDIALVLDHSGSMARELQLLQKASIAFIKHKYPNDRVSVVKFDHNIGTMVPLEKNLEKILRKSDFNGFGRFGGATALYAGTDEGIINLTNAANEKVVVLFTDGYENSSFQHFGRRAFHPNQVAEKLRDKGIRLFIISYGEYVNHELLSELAYLSGGKHYNILRKKDILRVFEELPRVFRHYYELTFKPRRGDGEHYLRLTYNDQVGDVLSTETEYYIGDKWDLAELEGLEDTMYVKYIPPDKKIIVNSQMVATFDFDKDTLKMKYFPVIDNYVKYLSDHPDAGAIIAGHTDTKGSDEYCYDLSERRALSVRDYMIDKGIDSKRLQIKGYGKDKLIWKDDTEEWKGWENRRVEVLIYE